MLSDPVRAARPLKVLPGLKPQIHKQPRAIDRDRRDGKRDARAEKASRVLEVKAARHLSQRRARFPNERWRGPWCQPVAGKPCRGRGIARASYQAAATGAPTAEAAIGGETAWFPPHQTP